MKKGKNKVKGVSTYSFKWANWLGNVDSWGQAKKMFAKFIVKYFRLKEKKTTIIDIKIITTMINYCE